MFESLRSGYQRVANGEEKRQLTFGEKLIEVILRTVFTVRGAIVALVLLWGIVFLRRSPAIPVIPQNPVDLITPVGTGVARYLHILIPANKKDINLCKTLVSARMLNYPVPSLINWEKEYKNDTFADGGWHRAKIEGVLDYLNMLGGERDGDLVFIPKGYDTWFQLRPRTLIERYYDINRNSEERTGRKQKIVFAAQKQCMLDDQKACSAVPESILPLDAYGKNTDTLVAKLDPAYSKFRERHLDTAFIMGEIGAMKKLFNKAQESIRANKADTDQTTFAKLFTAQEIHRQETHQQFLAEGNYTAFPSTPLPRDDKKPNLEFGIGLDYEGLLGASTLSAQDTMEWLSYKNSRSLSQARWKLGIPSKTKLEVSDDILRSPPPFWSRFGAEEDQLPRNGDWNSIPLFTNLYSSVIPATIHHPDSSPSSIRISGWEKMWFHGYERKLMDLYVLEPYKAFAVMREGRNQTAWWGMHDQKWVTRSQDKKEWRWWADICGGKEVEEGLFGDRLGEWKAPRTDY